MLKIKVDKRKEIGKKSKRLRDKGFLPAVFYGPKEDSTAITLVYGDFLSLWKEAGESTVISLEGVGEDKEALIQEVDFDPVSGDPTHVDFYVFEKGKKIEIEVPLSFVGEPLAVTDLGGSLVKVMHELPVEVLPQDLPQEIEVDVSGIDDFETHVTVGDLKLPEGVTALPEDDETVALVSPPREEEEEEEEEALEFDESMVEVEKKGKEEGEGGEVAEEGGQDQAEEKKPTPEENQ